MQALIVIDVQNGLVEQGDFNEELSRIEKLIQIFKDRDLPVVFMKHEDEEEESPLYKGSRGAEIHPSLKEYTDVVIEKKTPSSFYQTSLDDLLTEAGVDHIIVTGFNSEYCCLFTCIAGFDRGYEVTLIEDATATVNTNQTYDMKGLDIKDFIGTVLDWSDTVEVIDFVGFEHIYRPI